MPNSARSVTDQTWAEEVLHSDLPVLVDFWAEWCGPCRKISPMLDEIATEMGDRVKIVKLNIDENPNTMRDYGVLSIPMLTVFKNGKPVQQVVGVKPKSQIVKMIEVAQSQ